MQIIYNTVSNIYAHPMKRLVLLIAVSFSANCFAQFSEELSVVTEFMDSITYNELKRKLIKGGDLFYEDDHYGVRITCRGEYGGSIWFKNKRSKIEYSCSATCPVSINNIDGSYIVSYSLSHLSGTSGIIEIDDPELLEVFELPKPKEEKFGVVIRHGTDYESKSKQGANTLWSGVGTIIITSFIVKHQLYHIIQNEEGNTFLATLENDNMKPLTSISENEFWKNEGMTIVIDRDHFITFFTTSKTSGYVEIKENKISVYRVR